MAPLQQLTTAAATSFTFSTYDGFITKRNPPPQGPDLIDSHTLAVMCVSLSFAVVSVVAALFAFYWFVRMRRGFRQDMIMLLIQSDMAKALWLFISPLVYFITNKPLGSNWTFCQVSGFFLTVTIEASDIAVLLIAIHTTLFVVKRQHHGGAFGLQPYRRVAYTLWATIPIILAAIVPITGDGFVDNGPYCYLPIRPTWYRDTLAWIPRYIIFVFIIATYTGLYLYVYIRFRRFGEDQRRASTMNSVSTGSPTHQDLKYRWRSRSVPPTPHLTTHGLLDPPHSSMSKNDPSKLRQYSLASTASTLKTGEKAYLPDSPGRVVRKSSIAWNLVDFGHNGSVASASTMPCTDSVPDSSTRQLFTQNSNDINTNTNNKMATTSTAGIPAPEPAHVAGDSNRDPSPHNHRENRRNRWKRRSRAQNSDTGPRNSLANIIAALRRGPPRVSTTTTTTEHLNDEEAGGAAAGEEDLTNSDYSSVYLPTDESEEAMRRSRDRMKRQMRLLFVYPVIYLLTWIAPFVMHAHRYDAPSSPSSSLPPPSPLALRLVSMASLCVGAAADCVFFSAWERPWRHLRRGGFWANLAKRLALHRLLCVIGAVIGSGYSIISSIGGRGGGGSRGGLNVFAPGGFAGRDRDERVADERAARIRREREKEIGLQLRRKMAAGVVGVGGSSSSTAVGGGKSVGSERGVSVTGGKGGGGGDCGGGCGGEDMDVVGGTRRREWWDALDEDADE
ncbi:G protein-coupled glucose receptor regulating Gpa2-domain-containing protein [Xylaria sp. FL1777]|nr:G protein-coupled glucose receptor regulating Gpa2-domain-containing protein [Xylaria sp. FL1777]